MVGDPDSFSELVIPNVRMRIWSQAGSAVGSRIHGRWSKDVFGVGDSLRKDENLVAGWVRSWVSNPWSVVQTRFQSWLFSITENCSCGVLIERII